MCIIYSKIKAKDRILKVAKRKETYYIQGNSIKVLQRFLKINYADQKRVRLIYLNAEGKNCPPGIYIIRESYPSGIKE